MIAVPDDALIATPRRSWFLSLPTVLWLLGLAAAFLLFWSDYQLSLRSGGGLTINRHALWGRDFVNLWSAGRLEIEGKSAILYDVRAYQAWQNAQFGPVLDGHNFSYPPTALLYAPLFGALPYVAALALWSLGSVASFTLAARPWLARVRLAWWWTLLIPGTLVCLWAGHYGLLFGALWLFAWHRLDDRPVLAGVAIGLMLIKPHLAILIPLVLIRRRAWRALAVAALTAGILVAASIFLSGPSPWQIYFRSTAGLQVSLVQHSRDMLSFMMVTPAPLFFAVGIARGVAWVLQSIVALVVVGMLLWHLPEERHAAALLTAVATFLVLPYGFNYDLTIVGVAALLLFVRAVQGNLRSVAWIAAASLALSSLTAYLALAGLRLAPFILGALFVAMLREPELLANASNEHPV